MSRRRFEATSVAGGPPRYQILCPCGATDSVARQNLGAEAAQEQVPQKFSARGWHVGQRPDGVNDRCPACLTAQNAARRARRRPSSKPDIPTMNGHQPAAAGASRPSPPTGGSGVKPPPPAAEPPRVMSFDDRRVIWAKLDEVYLDADKGYAADWSDERVATDLGVPRAWVSTIRADNFGPALTAEVAKALTEITALRSELSVQLTVADKTKRHLVDLSTRLEAIERAAKAMTSRA